MSETILEIESECLTFTISARSKRISRRTFVDTGVLRVSGTSEVDVATITESIDGFGLCEQLDYKFTLFSKGGGSARIDTRDVGLLSDISTVAKGVGVSGYVNFGSKVGNADFELSDGVESISFSVEVFPSKIDYKTDYKDLLEGVNQRRRELAFRYFSATYRDAGLLDSNAQNSSSDWNTILRTIVDDIEGAFGSLRRRPVEVLAPDSELVRAFRVHRSSATLRRGVARGLGRGSWQRMNGVQSVRDRVPAEPPRVSLDTPEHRWLASELDGILSRLTAYLSSASADTGTGAVERLGVSGEEKLAVVAEIKGISTRILRLRNSYPLQSVPRRSSAVAPTAALRRRPGYAQAFRSISSLSKLVDVLGSGIQASSSDIASLYEMWCFFEVAELIVNAFENGGQSLKGFHVDEGVFATQLSREKLTLSFDAYGCEIEIFYNRPYLSLTGEHRPDISIVVRVGDLPPLMLILDAKYRQEWSVRGVKGVGPGAEAMNAMHRYRDAVAIEMDQSGATLRPVVKAVALFPANASDTVTFTENSLYRSVGPLGVGALPFLPSNRSYVEAWIEECLANVAATVAMSGPESVREAWRSLGLDGDASTAPDGSDPRETGGGTRSDWLFGSPSQPREDFPYSFKDGSAAAGG